MSKEVKYCKKCIEQPDKYLEKVKSITGWSDNEIKKYFTAGYYTPNEESEKIYCDYHPNEKLEKSNLTFQEYNMISEISCDISFIQAMESLKEKDPIEFQLKLAQFKATTVQQESATQQQNVPKCPTCGSTNIKKISAGSRWLSTGLFGISSGKMGKSMECRNCGYKW